MLSALLTVLILAGGEEPPPPKVDAAQETKRQEDVAKLARAKAQMLEVVSAGADSSPSNAEKSKATLHKEPILRWSNPTAGSVYGEVFLWQVGGRPAAVASIYRWYHPYTDSTVEIVSFSETPLQAKEREAVLWDSQTGGISFQSVSDAPTPATTRSGRLNQMRTISRRCKAELADDRGGEPVKRELRLLNQPVYRYESQGNTMDGALFAFVEVTDPEAWLLVETVQDGQATRWRYALARMNADAIEVQMDDKVIQSWPKVSLPWKDRKSTYTLFGFDPEGVKLDEPKEQK